VKLLLDTHFLLWAVVGHPRIDEFDWLDAYRPWGVSPVSLLEIRYLSEVGRLELDDEGFLKALDRDPRFVVDEVPLLRLIHQALPLDWTRDPFDRLLAAHSLARRTPLCTLDRRIQARHPLVLPAAEG
jgi:PIN domain nuclease of toxin-antitoxin system